MTSSDEVRETILRLLSSSEVDTISSPATKARLANGDEYIDLQAPGMGVQRVRGATPPTGEVLLRKAIYEDTWRRVVRQLTAARS